ncbi:MAG: 4-vinyl reductase [bacterium]
MDKSIKEKINRLIAIPCKTRGDEILILKTIIGEKYGNEGVRRVEKYLNELGVEFSFGGLNMTIWYPEGLNVAVIIAMREIFKLSDEDIYLIGRKMPKLSFIIRVFVKYFVSTKKTFIKTAEYWNRYLDCGKMEPYEINEDKRYAIFRVTGYQFDPVMCHYHRGYLAGAAENVIKSDKIEVIETACIHRGDSYHEYRLTW